MPSQDVVRIALIGGGIWLGMTTLITLAFTRWMRYQRECDERDRLARWREAERAHWRNGHAPLAAGQAERSRR
ncbi:MAG TPA: hypothetical protein VGJ60_06955 [Chloroflexota bacterium]|jgi:hypothetical protein